MTSHVISFYSKTSDQLVAEMILENVNLIELKAIFSGFGEDEELSQVYPITPAQRHELERLTVREIDDSQHEIFLEVYSSANERGSVRKVDPPGGKERTLRLSFAIVLTVVLIGCSATKQEQSLQKEQLAPVQPETISIEERKVDATSFSESDISIEYGGELISVARFNEKDVVAKHKVEYYPETDRIKNLDQLDVSDGVKALFRKPIRNWNFTIATPSESISMSPDINTALSPFGLQLSVDLLERLQRAPDYGTIKVATADIAVYLRRYSDSAYNVWIVEIRGSSKNFESALPFDADEAGLDYLLGEPNFKKKDGSVSIYSSLVSMQQLNVIWKERKIDRIQYITWTDW